MVGAIRLRVGVVAVCAEVRCLRHGVVAEWAPQFKASDSAVANAEAACGEQIQLHSVEEDGVAVRRLRAVGALAMAGARGTR